MKIIYDIDELKATLAEIRAKRDQLAATGEDTAEMDEKLNAYTKRLAALEKGQTTATMPNRGTKIQTPKTY